MITGINHITLAVSDLGRSIRFYQDTLGCRLVSRRAGDAYFDVGGSWLCLSLDAAARDQIRSDYTHLALSVPADRFKEFTQRLLELDVSVWKENRSEGESMYFLDPDGHKLEGHVGDLQSRLASFEEDRVYG